MSVEQTRGRIDCGTQGVTDAVSAERFRGVRIFDISDVKKPRQIAAVQTCRGSHTHTLVVDPKDPANVYIYGSGTSTVRSSQELAGCSGADPKMDPDTALFSIDVIQVPLAAPEKARIVNRPRIFSDPRTGAMSGLWPGGDHGPGTQRTSLTDKCHDVTVFPEIGLAAGACSGNGILLDISDPVHPVRLDEVADPNFAFWHSATFNNDGTKVIFTDEWGGGTRPRCRVDRSDELGRRRHLRHRGSRNCTLRGITRCRRRRPSRRTASRTTDRSSRSRAATSWRRPGIRAACPCSTSRIRPIRSRSRSSIAGRSMRRKLITGGFWSTYWYNGNIYGTEIARGLDIFKLTAERVHVAERDRGGEPGASTEFNAQHQQRISWAADDGRREGLPRSARAKPWHRAGTCGRGEERRWRRPTGSTARPTKQRRRPRKG